MNFRKCAFTLERRIQHVECSRVPTCPRRIALQYIAFLTYYPPNVALERNTFMPAY